MQIDASSVCTFSGSSGFSLEFVYGSHLCSIIFLYGLKKSEDVDDAGVTDIEEQKAVTDTDMVNSDTNETLQVDDSLVCTFSGLSGFSLELIYG